MCWWSFWKLNCISKTIKYRLPWHDHAVMSWVCVFTHQNQLLAKCIHSSSRFLPTASLLEPGEQRGTVCFHSSALGVITFDKSCISTSNPAPGSCTSWRKKFSSRLRKQCQNGSCFSQTRSFCLQDTKLSSSSLKPPLVSDSLVDYCYDASVPRWRTNDYCSFSLCNICTIQFLFHYF